MSSKPRAWLHTMDREGQPYSVANFSKRNPFGKPGVDYSACYLVTTEPLFTHLAPEPVNMILHCPVCQLQHIDAPDDRTPGWKNEPHRSHLCHGCGHIWRPADVHTNGVAAIKTQGKNDSPAPEPVSVPVPWEDRPMGRIKNTYKIRSTKDAEIAEWRALAAKLGLKP